LPDTRNLNCTRIMYCTKNQDGELAPVNLRCQH
jgi:hypothetical protein